MTPEERQILLQTHRLVEENNTLLRKMHRAALIGRIWHILYWVVIIALSLGAYYFIQPYIDQLTTTFGGFKASINGIQITAGQMQGIGDVLKGIGQ